MRVLACDPGYDRLGLAILESTNGKEKLIFSECFETAKDEPLEVRMLQAGNRIEELLNEYQPQIAGIERLYFNKNQKTAIGVAQIRGIFIFLALRAQCSVHEFGPQEIKIAVTGYGKSDKEAVFQMVRRLIPDIPLGKRDDEYDAIAVGITCLANCRTIN